MELYDLQTDPREESDVSAEQPEIVASLRHEYEAWFQDVSSTRPDNYAPPRIVLGSDRQPTVVLTKQDWRTDGERGWGRQGKWRVRIEGDSRVWFDVTVRISKKDVPLGNATATLSIGEQVFETSAKPGDKTIVFKNVGVIPGDADLQISIRDGDNDFGPHQVVVKK